jgi:hypothetical protein
MQLKIHLEIGNHTQTTLTAFLKSFSMEYQERLFDWIVSLYEPLSTPQND